MVLSLLVVLFVLGHANAERPLEKKEDATHVLNGIIKKLDSKESKRFANGILTDYTAEIAIANIKKGAGLKTGDKVKVYWFHVTKPPTQSPPAANGHHQAAVKKGASVRVYLMKRDNGYEVIYNPAGFEAVKK